ncbi:hypothetical protein ACFOGJ_28735 [Marinibaculum pumilum]|uniref:20S proteasome subunit A/B n=1 Tax=Marinibaculum pumilum TaxID=1766165 RepID=A0ABV7L9F1_9PROT
MTVCIAVRSQRMLLLASDRMLTAGDIQFEPNLRKMLFLTPAIAILFSGDADFHAEVTQNVKIEVDKIIHEKPDDWLNVKFIADLYLKYRNELKRRRAEADLLNPLGLSLDEFIIKQKNMHSDIVNRVVEDIISYPVPDVEVIVAGIDMRFGYALPSIYVIQNGEISCSDSISFAAIGSGARHAESELMLARHSYETPNAEALLSLYIGKRAAETAPGVGAETDIWALGANPGDALRIDGPLLEKVDREYRRIKRKADAARNQGRQEIDKFFEKQDETSRKTQSQSVESEKK